jgi:UDP-N-acetylmuramyl pentapeptide phosphotransferase/UDP-N-acetylglucosamine-1-phosphate transferase
MTLTIAAALISSAALSAALNVLLRPLLVRYALARPNARSSHRIPTPQGGGISVVIATLVVAAVILLVHPASPSSAFAQFVAIVAATILLAVVGAVDDISPLDTLPRLLAQAVAVAVVLSVLPADMHVVPLLPWWIERGLLLLAGIWFVNLVNFMDGIDWITVAEVVPVACGLVLIGTFGALPPIAVLLALTLLGAMIGFAPFNRPVARLFLGDVGSLPIGLLLCWMLMQLAADGHLSAALLLPLYYLADTTIVLIRRILAREPITQAHRSHFYQLAIARGFSVLQVVGRVFLLNVILVALAVATVATPSLATDIFALVLGAALVTWLLILFARGGRT